MRKLIFLDFDGVLHNSGGPLFANLPLFESYLGQMPDIEVIISSSWREGRSVAELKIIFSPKYRHQICGTTPSLECCFECGGRQKEIEAFLFINNYSELDTQWVAIDDMVALFSPDYKHLIATDSEFGFGITEGKLLLEWYKQAKFVERLNALAMAKHNL